MGMVDIRVEEVVGIRVDGAAAEVVGIGVAGIQFVKQGRGLSYFSCGGSSSLSQSLMSDLVF